MTVETDDEGPSPEQIEKDLALDPFAIECFHCALHAFTRKRGALRIRAGKGRGSLDEGVGYAATFLGELVGFQPEHVHENVTIALAAFGAGIAKSSGAVVEIVNDPGAQAPGTKH